MTDCSFRSSGGPRGSVLRCTNHATHTVQDRRPLPDGKLRPPTPACEAHALALLEANPTAYVITFGLWARVMGRTCEYILPDMEGGDDIVCGQVVTGDSRFCDDHLLKPRRCPVCGGLNPGDQSHVRCM